jgi:hypothetical protein
VIVSPKTSPTTCNNGPSDANNGTPYDAGQREFPGALGSCRRQWCGSGGAVPFGSGGLGINGCAGSNAAGGSRATSAASGLAGASGTSGAGIRKLITSLVVTYSYSIGAGGDGRTSNGTGGKQHDGCIVVAAF